MKKTAIVFAFCTFFVALVFVPLNAQGWQVYDGSVLPTETGSGGDSLDISTLSDNSPGTIGVTAEIIDDPDIPGNKIFKYLNPDGKTSYRHNFASTYTDTAFTIVARIKGDTASVYVRAFDFEWRNGNAGTRDKLFIWVKDSTIELDNNGAKINTGMSLYDWHTYRIAVNGDEATIFIDENPIPVHSALTTNASTDKYFKIGDGSGDNIGGYLDWCVLDTSGNYAPGEGAPFPEGFFVDGLSVKSPWLVYDGSILPIETGSGGDSLDISSVSDDSPGPGMVLEVIDDYANPGNKILKYLNPDGKTNFRHYFDTGFTDSAFTIMARIKGDTGSVYVRAFDFEWRNGNAGSRDKFFIWTKENTVELDNEGTKVDPGVDLNQWHTYRIAINGDLATIYMDENPTPVHSALTANTSTDKYLKIGDGSGDNIGGYMDWCILNMNGSFAPGEGGELPVQLIIDDYQNPIQEFNPWMVYNGSVLPAETAGGHDTLDISNVSDASPGPGMVQEIIDDYQNPGNKIFKYLNPDGKTNFRHYFADTYTDSAFTIIARVKGEADTTYDRAFDFEWRNGNAGSRDKLLLWTKDNLLELDNNGTQVDPGVNLYKWHTFRIAVLGDMTSVYIDENPVPIHSALTTNTTTDKYLKIGDGSGDNIGGYMDWCILNMDGAWAPGEGLVIPPDLIVDDYLNPIPEFDPWLVYDGSVLPTETKDGGDTLNISSLSDDAPGTIGITEEIIDDPDASGNKIFKYLNPDGKRNYRHYFADTYLDSAFTIMARVKGDTAAVFDRVFDFEWRNGNAGTRDKFLIWGKDSTVELDNNGAKVNTGASLYEWHTYRIVVNGDFADVYIDENVTPMISAATTNSTSDKYLKIGDGSGDNIGGYVDWVILNMSGAWPPGAGLDVPEGLIVDYTKLPEPPKWLVYNATMMPLETAGCGGDTMDISGISDDSPGTGFVAELIDDPDNVGNRLLKYLQPDAIGKTMYRHNIDAENAAASFTLMARISGERGGSYVRPFDLQWRNANANARDELRIWPADSTLELEKANVSVKVDMDLYGWHTYRVAIYGDSAVVFVDEYEEPFLTGVSAEATTDLYIKIGDGSGDAVGGYLDWCMLDISAAYGPGDGLSIPSGLIVDEYEFVPEPGWLVYDGNLLPTEASGGKDSLVFEPSEDSPGPDMVELIIDDPEISGNKLFQYEQPTSSYKRMYKALFNEYWKGTDFTLIVRTKTLPDYDQGLTIQWRHGNASARDDLRFYLSTGRMWLEYSAVEAYPAFSFLDWHTYRIAVYGDSAAVFVDEASDPVITGVTSTTTSDRYFKFGDRGSGTVGALLDWMVLDISGAYAPGEGVPIPEGLFVDTPDAIDNDLANLPKKFKLAQNFPNPFNPTTVIQYEVPRSSAVVIRLYDVLGREVMTMVNKEQAAGRYSLTLDASRLASGIYFYNMQADNFIQTKKMVLLK